MPGRSLTLVAKMELPSQAEVSPAPEMDLVHHGLTLFNRQRLSPSLPPASHEESWEAQQRAESVWREREHAFVEQERAQVRQDAAQAPSDAAPFARWFEGLRESGPGQGDVLFPYLANEASWSEMRWFLAQEAAGEAGFEDLVALTQLRMPTRPKLELARNYWDEMGRGREVGMHGPMLSRLTAAFDIDPSTVETVWESLALGNLLAGLASNRCYAFQAVGALGVVELTAPGRAAQVDAGLRRLGAPKEARTYFALHATLDVKHYQAWSEEVLIPLVAERPELAAPLAEGALMRLQAGARCFRRYRALKLGQ